MICLHCSYSNSYHSISQISRHNFKHFESSRVKFRNKMCILDGFFVWFYALKTTTAWMCMNECSNTEVRTVHFRLGVKPLARLWTFLCHPMDEPDGRCTVQIEPSIKSKSTLHISLLCYYLQGNLTLGFARVYCILRNEKLYYIEWHAEKFNDKV
jgi:hypothetical protein